MWKKIVGCVCRLSSGYERKRFLKSWFLEKLIPNLPEKSVVILDNASYHCRQVDKIPNMNTKKAEMLDFMKHNSITVPEPLPTKPVLLGRIKMANIQKKFAIDSIAFENGHLVLRLPPYHCCLNAIELVWHQLKSKARRQKCLCRSVRKSTAADKRILQ